MYIGLPRRNVRFPCRALRPNGSRLPMVAAREGLFFRDLLTELGVPLLGPTVMRSDNKSVKDLSLDAVAFKKTKHILRAANFLS